MAYQWRGYDVHAFESPEALNYSLAHARDRFATSHEVCALLMNPELYAEDDPPLDNAPHDKFQRIILTQEAYQQMALDSGRTNDGWLGYKENQNARTVEGNASDLKVNHMTLLPCRQLNGHPRYRRRVYLPLTLIQPGAVIYYFLEYKSFPNMDYRQRASRLAALAAAGGAGGVADGAAAAAGAGVNGAAGGADGGAAGGADGAAAAFWQEILDGYNSSSDEDYIPDEDDEEDDL